MVAGFGKRYSIYYPDGDVEQRTMLGGPRVPGDSIPEAHLSMSRPCNEER